MKRILCYGDSNVWGQAAYAGYTKRMADAKQWPNILQRLLGGEYRVIQEGLGGRIAGDFEARQSRNGRDAFEAIYYSAAPVDLVIISLGTNDLKRKFNRSPQNIAGDLLWYKEAINRFTEKSEDKDVKILYLSPANFISAERFDANQEARTALLALMREFPAPVLELDDLELSEDGVHYSENAHQAVAERVKEKIEEILA